MSEKTISLSDPQITRKTRLAIIFSSLIHEPFASLYVWLPFILRKDLSATVFQISLLVTLKPVISLVSFYWNSHWKGGVRSSFVISSILARLPFLFCPFTGSIWYFIFASTLYMLFFRASIPPWMEILKINLDKKKRQRYFALGSVLGYGLGVLLALYLGGLLDQYDQIWKILFSLFALFGMIGALIQGSLPLKNEEQNHSVKVDRISLLQPWKDTWELMRQRPDFAHFQWGFMAAGFGIMLVIAVAPLYFADILQLSHTDFANARYIFMGLGFVLCSPLWSRLMSRLSVFKMTSLVCLAFAIFPLTLIFAKMWIACLYIAYVIYGFAQSGSHMLWHLSGPLFAKNEDSSKYSGINIVMVGLRGMIAPMLGGILYTFFGSMVVLALGMLFCCFGAWFMVGVKVKEEETVLT
ncbi:MAG: MFS transporter [Simkaniaceae bacterium]|nr:MFS transporter [Simkaniaceae bacterium]